MADSQHSAEKDLLKIIENPQDVTPRAKAPKMESAAVPGEAVAAPAPKRSFDLKGFFSNRRNLITLLLITTILVFIFFIVNVFTERSKLKKTRNLEKFQYIIEGREQTSDKSAPAAPTEEAVSEPEKTFRNIFKPWSQKKEESESKSGVTGGLQDYKLVGLSIGKDPESAYAMVENAKTTVTHFLKKGDRLDGMELLSISEDRLVFKSNGKELELR